MTDLSPEAKDLLRQARAAFSPTDGRLAAVRDALKTQLPPPNATPITSGPVSGIAARVLSAAGWSAGQVIGTAVLIGALGAGGVTAWLATRSTPAAPEPMGMAAQVDSQSVPLSAEGAPQSDVPVMSLSVPTTQALADVPPAWKSVAAARDRARAAARAKSKTEASRETPSDPPPSPAPVATFASNPGPTEAPSDSLAEEVSMLRGARAALDRGEAAQALRLLDAHETRFHRGTLYEERLAARVLALCALGRIDAARSTAQELAHAAPQSPHLSRVRASCIAQPSGK